MGCGCRCLSQILGGVGFGGVLYCINSPVVQSRGAGGDVDVKLLALGSGANLARWQVTCRAQAWWGCRSPTGEGAQGLDRGWTGVDRTTPTITKYLYRIS